LSNLIGNDEDFEIRNIPNGLDFNVLLKLYDVPRIVVVHLLQIVDLFLTLIPSLSIAIVLDEISCFPTKVVHLLLEDIIDLLLVHLPLLLGGEPNASCELLHLSFYTL
jgi:hypothetical protein